MTELHSGFVDWTREGLRPVIEDSWKAQTYQLKNAYCNVRESGYTDWDYTITTHSRIQNIYEGILPEFQNVDKTVDWILETTKDFPGYRTMLCEIRNDGLSFQFYGGETVIPDF
jgi:hypothetical protein